MCVFYSETFKDVCLSYRKYGAESSTAVPVLFFHGNMCSRVFSPMWEKTTEVCSQKNVTVYALDRPGIGDSTFSPAETGYTYFARLVADFVDSMKIDSFNVIGFSSGGPFALAVAAFLQARVVSVSLVSSDAPYHLYGTDALMERYGSTTVTEDSILSIKQIYYDVLKRSYDEMNRKDRSEMALADLEEAVKHGFKGVARDALLEGRPWDFPLDQFNNHTKIFVYHGVADDDVDIKYSRFLCTLLGKVVGVNENMVVKYFDGENHSLIRRKWPLILDNITKRNNSNFRSAM